MDILDTIDGARRAFEIAGRGCLVRFGEDEPRYATVSEIAARLEPHADATMLLTAVSEAVERYDPSRAAAILLEVPSGERVRRGTPLRRRAYVRRVGALRGFQALMLSPHGWDYVGGLDFGPAPCASPSTGEVDAYHACLNRNGTARRPTLNRLHCVPTHRVAELLSSMIG